MTDTIIKKIRVATPIQRVSSGAFSVANLGGVNLTGVVEGSILVYDAASSAFVVDSDLSSVYVEVNGGSF
jgi:hypothetical protein